MVKKKKLTKKQELVVAALVDPTVKTQKEAAKRAGVSERHIQRMSSNVLVQEALQSEKDKIIAETERLGFGCKQAAKMIVEGSKAKTTGQFGGDPDHKTRHVFLETFLKLKGVLSDGKVATTNTQINIHNYRDAKTEDLVRSLDEIISAGMPRESVQKEIANPSV